MADLHKRTIRTSTSDSVDINMDKMEPLVRCPVMTYLGSNEVNLKSAGGTSKQKVKKNDFMSNPEALQSAKRLKLIDFIGRTRALQKCMMVSILQ